MSNGITSMTQPWKGYLLQRSLKLLAMRNLDVTVSIITQYAEYND